MRVLTVVLSVLALGAFAGCPTEGGSGGGGDLACDAGMSTRKTCPTDPNVHELTAVEALQELKDSFEAQFPEAVWMGGIAGLYIGRDGRSRDEGVKITYGGFTIENASGWTGNFCVDQPEAQADDQLNFDTSNGDCTALRNCLVVNCNAVTPRAFPAIDTPAAIQAAFPGDPSDALYQVQLVLDLGNHWTITRYVEGGGGESRKVDATTGAVIE